LKGIDMTTNFIAKILADVFKKDDDGKVEVYTDAYRKAWGNDTETNPEDPQGQRNKADE
jgi:hypothetical protein